MYMPGQTKAARLREYGMYIRRTAEGEYNLGWTYAQRKGGIATFPTYDEAYDTFENIVDGFWEFHADRFMEHAEASLYRAGG